VTLRSMWVLTGSNSRHNRVAYFGRSNSNGSKGSNGDKSGKGGKGGKGKRAKVCNI
jgi:hypothetical protein